MTIRSYIGLFAAVTVLLAMLFVGGCANPQGPTDPTDLTDPAENPPDPEPEPDPVDPEPEDPEPEDPEPEPEVPEILHNTTLINFDETTPEVCAGQFGGAGIMVEPEPGQLDADSWSVAGFSDGDLDFGVESAAGDFARGTSAGGVTTGGLYAFEVEEGDYALGIQPTSSDFSPGSLTLRVALPSPPLADCTLSYRAWARNDQNRSSVWSVTYSVDGEAWTDLPELAFTTPQEADPEPSWLAADLEASFSLADAVPAGGYIYVRWSVSDGDGDGSRDESAIDDIVLDITYVQ
jgi:hypothetical protein